MGQLHTYDVARVSMVFGSKLISGYAPDSAIKVEYDEDLWDLQVGGSGEAIRSKKNNLSATITFRIMPGTEGNRILGLFLAADIAANAGALPLQIVDPSTGTVHFATGAWVQKPPAKDYAQQGQAIEWTIRTGELLTEYGAAD